MGVGVREGVCVMEGVGVLLGFEVKVGVFVGGLEVLLGVNVEV